MEKIKLPNKYTIEEVSKNKSQIIIEPVNPGFGITLGNALRRILLSSIDGAAVTAIKIKGADHEFSTLENVKEDVVDIILNLKKVRVKVDSDEPVKIKLITKGDKIVTASDIEKNAQVEVTNPELELLTLTNPKAEFEAEITVEKGRGYIPVESRSKEKAEIGIIMIDAIYTPIKTVNFHVEDLRVGQMTNWNKLIMEIETDGSITPDEAVKKASEILVEHFSVILDPSKMETIKEEVVEEETEAIEVKEEELPVHEEKPEEEATEDEPKKKRGRPKKNPE